MIDYPALGLKARDVIAWAGASLASRGPGYRYTGGLSLKGRHHQEVSIRFRVSLMRSSRPSIYGGRPFRACSEIRSKFLIG